MYVIYPASRLVGLTINYREINQIRPFPPRNPSEEPQEKEEGNPSVKETEPTTTEAETLTDRPELLNEGPNESNSNKDPNNSQCSYSKNNRIETGDNHSNSKPDKENSLKASDTNLRKKSVSPINKRSKSESPKNKSESPQSVLKKFPSKRQIKNSSEEIPLSVLISPVENRQVIKTLTLEENLKNLEVYRVTKPPLKRSWSLHFKKAVTTEFIKMAALECTLREMTHPALNETLKAHNAVAFKLVKTGK